MKRRAALLAVLGLYSALMVVDRAIAERATTPLLDETILKRIQDEVSGSICFEHIRKLTTLHRIWGGRDYHEAAQYMADKASEYGLKDAVVEKYPIKTGKEDFWMQSTGGYVPWDCRSGALRLVSPFPMLISDFESAGSTVAVGSRSTNTVADVVYVGRGDSDEAYRGKDVREKIVLAEGGRHEDVHELAVHKLGALGTLQFYNTRGNYYESEGIYWASISPWSKDGTRNSTFGFNLSATQGLFLKELLAKGEKVIVSAKIDAQIVDNGSFELATAVIPGARFPDEEFIFYAHLDHPKPGAHDNGSGDGVLLEIARTLSSLITRGVIPAPQRSIRFMWIPHMSGLNMYFTKHPEKIGKVKAGCNIDCVGLDQAKFPSKFYVGLPPHSLPTYLTDLTINLVGHLNHKIDSAINEGPQEDLLFSPEGSRNLFSVTLAPYQGASDEYTANTRSLNIPSIYFHDFPIPPRHNQINFLDYIDPTNLRRISYLGAIISYAWADAGDKTAARIINEVSYRAEARLSSERLKAIDLFDSASPGGIHQSFARGRELLFWGLRRERGMADALEGILSKKTSLDRLSSYRQSLEKRSSELMAELTERYRQRCAKAGLQPKTELLGERRTPTGGDIPVQNPSIKGSPGYFSNYFEEKLGEDFLSRYKQVRPDFSYGNVGYYETLNYVDGRNSLEDIYRAVQAELWSEDYSADHSLSFEETAAYIQMLKDAGVLDLKKR